MKTYSLSQLLIFVIITCFFACNNQNDNVVENATCYFKITLNDPLNTCGDPNYLVQTSWFGIGSAGSYQLANNSAYTTATFETPKSSSPYIQINAYDQCNDIEVKFYAEGTLIETKNVTLGFQSDCLTYCKDGTSIILTFTVPE